MSASITYDDFSKVDIRVGTVLSAEPFPKAKKPAYQLHIDFGPEIGLRRSSAQITALYQPEALVGRQVLAVVNFPPKQIANFFSECLVLGVSGEHGHIVLLATERAVENGQKIH